MYVITGATGNSGRRIAEMLLAAGKKVRVIGRGAERLAPLVEKGADPFAGSLEDAGAMGQAFTGATAAYIMIPPKMDAEDFRAYQNEVAASLCSAIQDAGVERVVSLSSLGAELPEGTGPIAGLHELEQRLNALEGISVLHLRPAYFMENWLLQIETIKRMHVAGSPIREDLKMPMIAIRDIAEFAAERLLKGDFLGRSVRELHGQRDLTHQEAAHVLGRAIGRENLPYIEFAYDDYAKGMRAAGLSADVARTIAEMYYAMNAGLIHPIEPRSAENSSSTAIEDFAPVFAAVYNQ